MTGRAPARAPVACAQQQPAPATPIALPVRGRGRKTCLVTSGPLASWSRHAANDANGWNARIAWRTPQPPVVPVFPTGADCRGIRWCTASSARRLAGVQRWAAMLPAPFQEKRDSWPEGRLQNSGLRRGAGGIRVFEKKSARALLRSELVRGGPAAARRHSGRGTPLTRLHGCARTACLLSAPGREPDHT